jgi:hypothetical protein
MSRVDLVLLGPIKGAYMSLRPSLPTKMLHRTSQSLPRCAAAVILSLFLFCSPESRASETNQFIQLTNYPSGGTPAKIVSGDFNRDGKADVVALNSNNVLSILLGTGKGTFAAPKTIATLPANSAGFPTLMVAGDFNGDGNPDLLVVPSPGNAVKVFLGHGDGTFAAPVSIKDGLPSAGSLAVDDFNGDDRADIVVAGTTSVAVLLGKSSGIFATPIVTATNLTAPGHLILAVGDVNRDSHLDVVATDENGDFQVLLGTGSGTFNKKPAVSTNFNGPNPESTVLAIGDFNGDGNPDIAAGMVGDIPDWALGQVCLLSGYGDGTFNFGQASCYRAPNSFGEMLVPSLNGKPDLLFSSDPLIIQLNNGSGVFTQSNYAAGGGTMALGDFNGDGKQDIAFGTAGGVQVVLNAGSGLMRAPLDESSLSGPFTSTATINSTDFNGDGYADVAVLDYFDEHGYLEPTAGALLGAAKNTFLTDSGSGLGFVGNGSFNSSPPAIGDFNHDGYLDFAIAATGSVMWLPNPVFGEYQPYLQVFFGDGKGNFLKAGPALEKNSNFLAAGDFNGDGNADLASVDGSTFEILKGKGDGTFAPAVTYPVGTNPVYVLKRDLNGDGKIDIIVVNQGSNNVSVLLGKGDGTFLPQKTFAAGTAPVAAVTGDFNRDGKIDIAVATSKGVSILLGNGNGTFQAQKTYSAGGPMTAIVEASARQDGIEDLIGIDSATQRFVLLPGVGNGTFGAPVVYPVDRVPTQIVAGDFNHDGATDIVLLGNGGLAVFYNQGGDHVALASSLSKPKANQSVTFTAHVTTSYGEMGTPTGKVTFKDGTRILGNVNLNAGKASITSKLTAGTHKILAQYAGNTNFNPNQSSTLTLVVGP